MPYAVFKNPTHHKEEMLDEIGKNDHYPFAHKFQKVLRTKETVNLLLAELDDMPFLKKVSNA
jgi:hypothetical protein